METRLQSNEIRIPKPELKTSFDLLNTSNGSTGDNNCQHYFKSSFARSLSTFGASPQSKSLDFTINYGYPQARLNSSIDEEQQPGGLDKGDDEGTLLYSTLLEPLSMPPMFDCGEMQQKVDRIRNEKPVSKQSTESLVSSSSLATVRNVWTGNAQVCPL